MDYIIYIAVAVVIGAWICAAYAYSKRRRKSEQARKATKLAEAQEFFAQLERSRSLPAVNTNILLKTGELAFYFAETNLYETRAVRHYQSGHTGVRVAKGVYVGGSSGRSSSSQEWSKIATGCLAVTNKRVFFNGGGQDRVIPLSKIVSVNSSISEVEISVEGRQKSMVFDAQNAIILANIIRLCCQVEDPRDLSRITLNVVIASS